MLNGAELVIQDVDRFSGRTVVGDGYDLTYG